MLLSVNDLEPKACFLFFLKKGRLIINVERDSKNVLDPCLLRRMTRKSRALSVSGVKHPALH